MGVYVFSKRQQFREWSGIGANLGSQSNGYSTVTHCGFIHIQCHQEQTQIDRNKQPPIREWDGAKVRNHLTLCNNLLPVFGGTVRQDCY